MIKKSSCYETNKLAPYSSRAAGHSPVTGKTFNLQKTFIHFYN